MKLFPHAQKTIPNRSKSETLVLTRGVRKGWLYTGRGKGSLNRSLGSQETCSTLHKQDTAEWKRNFMAKELVNQMKGQATEGKIFASYKLADRQYLEYTLNFLKINKNKKTIQSKHGYRSDKILQRRNGSHHLESSTTTRLHWLHFGYDPENKRWCRQGGEHSLSPDSSVNWSSHHGVTVEHSQKSSKYNTAYARRSPKHQRLLCTHAYCCSVHNSQETESEPA